MEVTGQTFVYHHLPRILDDLASCCFVSIDFEFSGIAKAPRGPAAQGRQTLQQRYDETKRAAERYSIVQVGLTVCHEDIKTATYTLKPYNINLSPTIDEKVEVDRDCVFQGSAIEFLLDNKFHLENIYRDGVPYLSRQEEAAAMAKALERRNPLVAHTTLDVEDTDTESLQFLQSVRREIDAWLAAGTEAQSYLNIPPPSRLTSAKTTTALPVALNRFQKRLVYQLLETEYPSLVAVNKPLFIQLIVKDAAHQEEVKESRLLKTRQRIWKQTGFRWVAEALVGGDLFNLEPDCFVCITSSSTAIKTKCSVSEFADRLKRQLKSHRPVLVGHNLFTDLVYFCQCFFGPLPDRVECFQALVRSLFPVVMDTKYMATHDCGSINPSSSLSEINAALSNTKIPTTIVHPKHKKYSSSQIEHEAGYDSLLTAQIFIKLSAQLRDGGSPKLPTMEPHLEAAVSNRRRHRISSTARQPSVSGATSRESQGDTVDRPQQLRGYKTRFDLLSIDASEDSTDLAPDEPPTNMEDQLEAAHKARAGLLIPRRDAEFWNKYGNTLRVFGTQERVCFVGSPAQAARLQK